MDEIERFAPAPLPAATLDAWRRDIARAFTDVSRGDVLCGVYLPEHGARFYTNGRLTAEVTDPAFARADVVAQKMDAPYGSACTFEALGSDQ